MARKSRLEDQLVALGALRREPRRPGAVEELSRALGDRSSFVVAAAARIVGEAAIAELVPSLRPAFDRFIENGAETDKSCQAKMAIVNALLTAEFEDAELFLRGMHCVQLEAAWGPPVDTAAQLRGMCATTLACWKVFINTAPKSYCTWPPSPWSGCRIRIPSTPIRQM